MEGKIKKSDLTKFAKDCVYAHEKAVKLECISEDIMRSQIGKELINDNQSILLEVSKRFAKYARENMNVDLDNGEAQNLQNILNAIIDCCRMTSGKNSIKETMEQVLIISTWLSVNLQEAQRQHLIRDMTCWIQLMICFRKSYLSNFIWNDYT